MSSFQTVVLTGANRGIGLELARQLADRTDRLLACCRDPSSANELQSLAAASGGIEVRALDVTDTDQVGSLASDLDGKPVDLLLNNAGVYGPARSDPLDLAAWRQVLEVNTLAPIHLAYCLLDSIRASRRRLIVNVSSKVGSMADNRSGGAIAYRSSKAALNSATRSLAIDEEPSGVVAFVVHPGWVQTAMGGPNALIDTQTSARQLLELIESADESFSGRFFDRDGSEIPW